MSARPPRSSDPASPLVHRTTGPAQEFHDRNLTATERAEIWFHRTATPALVLGSTQNLDQLDTTAARDAGWEVARRRSGGGLVVVQPDAGVWVDVIVPRSHPRWDDDVNRAFHWVGQAWLEALRPFADPIGLVLVRHTGPLLEAAAGRAYCFAGRGPGEVFAQTSSAAAGDPPAPGAAADRPAWKIVGISQRRTRDAARFQCLGLVHHDPGPALRFVAANRRVSLQRTLSQTRAGWPPLAPAPPIAAMEASVERALRSALTLGRPSDG